MSVEMPYSLKDILICEDHPFFQYGIEEVFKKLLPQSPSFRRAGNAADCLNSVEEKAPDLLLMDLELPDQHGSEVIQRLKQSHPNLKILVITSCDNPISLRHVLSLGVDGMMQKASSTEQLNDVLTKIYGPRKEPALDARMEALLKEEQDVQFTPREYEVLERIAKGLSNQEIAEELSCALTTVRFHRANIMQKTNMRNAAEMTAWFLKRNGKIHGRP